MALFTGTTVSVISDNKLAKNATDSMTGLADDDKIINTYEHLTYF